ncbi:MAG TPA: hypothetical protein VN442_13775, partial [Bryobacteraceae bacterium]|nr:hypothetical protein [Bryobacteraceae bacterium]
WTRAAINASMLQPGIDFISIFLVVYTGHLVYYTGVLGVKGLFVCYAGFSFEMRISTSNCDRAYTN